jgi:hypothetical protein
MNSKNLEDAGTEMLNKNRDIYMPQSPFQNRTKGKIY